MTKCSAVTLFVIVVLGTTLIYGQTSNTFVSGSGNDNNSCSRTAPCKTFAGALSKTIAGGEIDVLDGGNFGVVTITKAITIDGGGGVTTSIFAQSNNGIVVAAGSSDVVILKNIRIDGLRGTGNAGLNGIRWTSGGGLIVDKCEIFGFSNNGVDIAQGTSGQAWITNTNIQNIGGTGIAATTTSGIVTLVIEQVRVELPNIGIQSGNHSRVIVNNSLVQYAGSIGIQIIGDAIATINLCHIDLNGSGIITDTNGTNSGVAFVSNSQIAFNTNGLNNQSGTFNSYGNNRVHDNINNTVGTISLAQTI